MGFRCKYSHSRQEQWEQRPLVLQWMWRNRWIIQLDGWEKRVHSGDDTVGLETQWTIVETWGAQLPFDENRVCGMSTLSELLTEWCCNTFSWIQKHEKALLFFWFWFFFFFAKRTVCQLSVHWSWAFSSRCYWLLTSGAGEASLVSSPPAQLRTQQSEQSIIHINLFKVLIHT